MSPRRFQVGYQAMPGGRGFRAFNPFRRVNCPIDGPRGWYVPEEAAHFIALGLNIPDFLWLMNEASGNLVGSIGSVTFTAIGSGHLYQQTVPGWKRPFVGTVDGTVGQGWETTNAALNLASGESVTLLMLASFQAPAASPAATRGLMSICVSTNDGLYIQTPTGFLRPVQNSVVANGVIPHGDINTVHTLGWQRDAANDLTRGISEHETVFTTHVEPARTGQLKTVAATGSGGTAPGARIGWYAIFKGANAEFDMSAYLARLRGD